jgi:hypothetical protein
MLCRRRSRRTPGALSTSPNAAAAVARCLGGSPGHEWMRYPRLADGAASSPTERCAG